MLPRVSFSKWRRKTMSSAFNNTWRSVGLRTTVNQTSYWKSSVLVWWTSEKWSGKDLAAPEKEHPETGHLNGAKGHDVSWLFFFVNLSIFWQPYSAYLQLMWSDSMSFSIARHLILPVGFEQEAHTLLSFWQQLEHAMWPFEHCKCHTKKNIKS